MELRRLAFVASLFTTLHCANPALAQVGAGAPPAPASTSDAAGATPSNYAPAASASGTAGAPTSGPADYKLGVGDHLRVSVYNEPDLSGEVAVSANGAVSMPLIGSINLLGDTASQAATKVQQALAGRYLKDPHVSIEILTYRPFYILGEVTKPGEYAYSNGLTVLNAVATAEGFTYRANKKFAFIKHSGEVTEHRIRVAPETTVEPGDTIRIGERFF